MPDGLTHNLVNAALLGAGAAALHALGVNLRAPEVLSVLAGAAVGTLLVTPDLDMLSVRTDARRSWGRLDVLWWPLLLVSRHRGMSHTWLRGPLLRAAYLGSLLVLLGWGAGALLALLGTRLPPLPLPWPLLAWALLGYLLMQWAHLILDRIPLTWRRL